MVQRHGQCILGIEMGPNSSQMGHFWWGNQWWKGTPPDFQTHHCYLKCHQCWSCRCRTVLAQTMPLRNIISWLYPNNPSGMSKVSGSWRSSILTHSHNFTWKPSSIQTYQRGRCGQPRFYWWLKCGRMRPSTALSTIRLTNDLVLSSAPKWQ